MRFHLECTKLILAGEKPCMSCEMLLDEIEMDTGREEWSNVQQMRLYVPE